VRQAKRTATAKTLRRIGHLSLRAKGPKTPKGDEGGGSQADARDRKETRAERVTGPSDGAALETGQFRRRQHPQGGWRQKICGAKRR